MHEILEKAPKPAKLSDVQKQIDSASRENLIEYLGVVARLYVNRLDPNDARRNSTAQRLADELIAGPELATGYATQFLRLHAETIAAKGGFTNVHPAIPITQNNIFIKE